MEKTVKCIEVRTAEGQLILSLNLVEKEVDPAGRNQTSGNRKTEARSGNQGNGNGSQNAEAMTDAQKRYLFRILAEQGIEGDAAFDKLKSLFDVNALKDVSKREASRVIEQLLENQGG